MADDTRNALIVPEMSFDTMRQLAEAVAKSRMFGITTTDQAIVLMAISAAEGRHPVLAARDYDIIQGKPTKKAEAMMRDFQTAGGTVEWHRLDDTIADATFCHPVGGKVRISWDMARATKAGLASKDNWRKFPRAMLRSRVVSEGVRTVFPAATTGMYVADEIGQFVTSQDDPIDITPPAATATTEANRDPPPASPQPQQQTATKLNDAEARELAALIMRGGEAAARGKDDFTMFWNDPDTKLYRPELRVNFDAWVATARAADAPPETPQEPLPESPEQPEEDQDPFGEDEPPAASTTGKDDTTEAATDRPAGGLDTAQPSEAAGATAGRIAMVIRADGTVDWEAWFIEHYLPALRAIKRPLELANFLGANALYRTQASGSGIVAQIAKAEAEQRGVVGNG